MKGPDLDFVPPVPPRDEGEPRPLWSVMIPVYNCAGYLREALRSVLDQDPGPAAMQIEVVDDASSDRPEDVAGALGAGRVTFHRHPRNLGAIENFNSCLQRSRGRLVHILHGDDLVRPGFYERIGALADGHPEAALLAARSFVIDESGVILGVTPRLPALEGGSRDPAPMLYHNPLQCASVVVRRSFYERFGGFRPALVHTADWEMWVRAVAEGGGAVLSEPLACYRVFATNDTARLRRAGENLRDCLRFAEVVARRVPTFEPRRLRRRISDEAAAQARGFARAGDRAAIRANLAVWREATSLGLILGRAAENVLDRLTDLWRKLVSWP